MSDKLDFCPRCGRNYPDENVTWCENCGTKLVTEENVAATKHLLEKESVSVYEAQDPIEAEMCREILETNGIMCALVGTVPSSVFPFTVDGLAKVRIVVLENVADDAKRIIEQTIRENAEAGPDYEQESTEDEKE